MKVKIIYSTQSGTTEYVAEVMQKHLSTLGHLADLHNVKKAEALDLNGYDAILFGAPTYENGRLESGMQKFVTSFKSDFSKYKIGVFGLGNSMYPEFCTSAQILHDWVIQQHGKVTTSPLRVDGFPEDVTPLQHWVEEFIKA